MRNQMYYGILGSKEMLAQKYKNFNRRIKLKCDGKPIDLPTLQGIVVLNICSYMGGTNFVCILYQLYLGFVKLI
jgi:diacylglycerol kinase (ATP)